MDFTCIVGEPCAISLVGVELEIDDAVTLHRARFRRTSTCADGAVRWGWGDRLAQPAPVYGFEFANSTTQTVVDHSSTWTVPGATRIGAFAVCWEGARVGTLNVRGVAEGNFTCVVGAGCEMDVERHQVAGVLKGIPRSGLKVGEINITYRAGGGFVFPAGSVKVLGPDVLESPWICMFGEICEVTLRTSLPGTLEAAYACLETADPIGVQTRATEVRCDALTGECHYTLKNLVANTWTLCWRDGDGEMAVGTLEALGPREDSHFCEAGLTCEVRIRENGDIDARVALATGPCEKAWPDDVVAVSTAVYRLDGASVYNFGVIPAGLAVNYNLCWMKLNETNATNASAEDVALMRNLLNASAATNASSAAVATNASTGGVAAGVYVGRVHCTGASHFNLVCDIGATCAVDVGVYGHVFVCDVGPDSRLDAFNRTFLITEKGAYPLCMNATQLEADASGNLVAFEFGLLTVRGPTPMDHVCVLGEPCALPPEAFGGVKGAEVFALRGAIPVAIPGLQLPANQSGVIGRVTAVPVLAVEELGWRAPGGEFVILGNWTIAGPYTGSWACAPGECRIRVQGHGRPGGRIGLCGWSATALNGRPSERQAALSFGEDLFVGSLPEGDYEVCWSAYADVRPVLTVLGPLTVRATPFSVCDGPNATNVTETDGENNTVAPIEPGCEPWCFYYYSWEPYASWLLLFAETIVYLFPPYANTVRDISENKHRFVH